MRRNKAMVLNCQYLTEDRQVKVYIVPAAPDTDKPVCGTAGRILKKLLGRIFLVTMTASCVVPVGLSLLEAVRQARGYDAIGGEYLFLAALAFGIYRILSIAAKVGRK